MKEQALKGYEFNANRWPPVGQYSLVTG